MDYLHGGDIYTYGEMLDFSVNLNPFGPSEKVLEAAKRGVGRASAYPDSRCRKLVRGLSEKFSLPESYFLIGNGAADLIFLLVSALKPRRALIPVPAFAEYERALRTADCEIEFYPLKEENWFRLDEGFLEKLKDGAEVVFLCSPSNPAGQVIPRPFLERIGAVCSERKIWLVLDECFIDFVQGSAEQTMIKLIERYPYMFLIRAFTKLHAIPGLRLGYGVCANRELLERMGSCRQPWSVSTPAQEAGLAALEEEEERGLQVRKYLRKERDRLSLALEDAGVRVIPTQANYLLFYSEKELFAPLAERGILIRDCENYRGLWKGWYRAAVRQKEENDRLIEAVREVLCGRRIL